MLSAAETASFVSLSIMMPICSVAFLVSSERFLISSATTANPFPASPALAASIVIACTSFMLSFSFSVVTFASLFISATSLACAFNFSTSSTPSSTVAFVFTEMSPIFWASSPTLFMLFCISAVLFVCCSIWSALSFVLAAISETELLLVTTASFSLSETALADENFWLREPASSTISSDVFIWLCAFSFTSSRLSLESLFWSLVTRTAITHADTVKSSW